ncbi:hypothetical protein [Flavobacterium sp. J27]|uniref:hypothetical protein n=1 Tax=Flavobacterium sp. J27 TaxID=2060419 RepID=UPI00102F3CD9|nr:hypothetical protein [Flavobacterium sp. J27]
MKNKIKGALLALVLIIFNSCAVSNIKLYTETKVVAVNVKLTNGSWLVDDPMVQNLNKSFISTTLVHYKKELRKNVNGLKTMEDFDNMTTLNSILKEDVSVLSFYKKQTNCDYLIQTELNLVKNELPRFQLFPNNELHNYLKATITVYDLNTKNIVFQREYESIDQVETTKNIAFATKLDNFIDESIKQMIQDFRSKYHWKYVDSSYN